MKYPSKSQALQLACVGLVALAVPQVASAQDYGIRYVTDTTGILYHVDNNYTASFNYLCLDGACIAGNRVDGEFQREVSVTLGQTYSVEFKIQHNPVGQILVTDSITYTRPDTPQDPPDAGVPDTGDEPPPPPPDAGVPDTGDEPPPPPPDAGVPDTGDEPPPPPPDAGVPDSGDEPPPDAGTPCNEPPGDPAADFGEGFEFGMTTGGLVYHNAEPGHTPSFAILGLISNGRDVRNEVNMYEPVGGGDPYPRYENQVNGVDANATYTLEIRLQGNQFGSGQCIHSIDVRPGEGIADSPCYTAPAGAPPGAPATPKAVVAVRILNGGASARLVGGPGSAQPDFALYTFDNDEPDVSRCFNGCAENWPPLVVDAPEDLVGAGGVTGNFGTIERVTEITDPCGGVSTVTKYQVTYNRQPLYFYANDTSADNPTGQNVSGWRFASADLIPQLPVIPNPLEGLPTPTLGTNPGSHGYTFDLDGRSLALRLGQFMQIVVHQTEYVDGVGDVIRGIGNPEFEFYCSNNQIQWHSEKLTATELGRFSGTVPGSCYGNYWYFFRFAKKGPVNNDPESRWTYSGLFVEDETNPGARVNPANRPTINDSTANWFRFRHPHAHDGNTEAIFDSQNNSSLLAGLARFESSVSDGPSGVNLTPGVGPIRIEALESGVIPNFVPTYAYNTQTCCGNAFSYGNVISYEITAVTGAISSQTYNTHQHIVVGQGFNSPLGDPRLTLAGKAATNMVFSDSGSHIRLEKDAVFTQHVTTLTSAKDVDDFLKGHHLFHGVDPSAQGSTALHNVLIGSNTCGNCHFRDGRGSEITQTAKGPLIPPPVFGVGLLAHIEGAEVGLTWDGSAATVREQTANALQADHGVTSDSLGSDYDLIVAYTEFLSVPNREPNAYAQTGVADGHVLFHEVGCAGCHVENQRTRANAPAKFRNLIIKPFTDMRLHNLGNGSFRTAPLWGLGTNIRLLDRNGRALRLMHDGSATSIGAAISAHGGDASSVRSAFNALSSNQQTNIINFLRTL